MHDHKKTIQYLIAVKRYSYRGYANVAEKRVKL